MFFNPNDAKDLRWNADDMRYDELLRHLAICLQWENIDK